MYTDSTLRVKGREILPKAVFENLEAKISWSPVVTGNLDSSMLQQLTFS